MAKEPVIKDPAVQIHSRLVRTIEANLKITAELNAEETQFRRGLLGHAVTALDAMNATLVTRLYEAACALEFPKQGVAEFRRRLEIQIAKTLGLPAPKPAAAARRP